MKLNFFMLLVELAFVDSLWRVKILEGGESSIVKSAKSSERNVLKLSIDDYSEVRLLMETKS